MYGILGEDNSDTETLKVLIRRLAGNPKLPVKQKGCNGCSQLLRKGKTYLQLFASLSCQRFVICYDSDGDDPEERRRLVQSTVVNPSGVAPCCILVPVEELEAWILADIEAVTHVFPSWTPRPETIRNPKETLVSLSRAENKKPIYSHTTHNPIVAAHLRLDYLRKKCPSFLPLDTFVTGV